MSSKIDLKNFVDINIQRHVTSKVTGTRDTVVLFTSEGTQGEELFTSYSESMLSEAPIAKNYAKIYFEHGGVKLLVKYGVSIGDLDVEMLNELDKEIICVAYATSTNDLTTNYAALKALIKTDDFQKLYGIDEKIILARTGSDDAETEGLKNFVVKYASEIGAEMTIAAYLSKINVYENDTVFDYAFTEEKLADANLTNSLYESLISHNINVDIELTNVIRNCGGNMKDGEDLTNNFIRIVLQQTLTNRLIDLLVQKLKDSSGIGKMYAVIAEELQYYLNAGYLTTDKIWKEDNLYKTDSNGVQYLIVEKGTPLTKGYVCKILPLSSLSDDDRRERKAPDIYLILADQYGIRKITLNGEVI